MSSDLANIRAVLVQRLLSYQTDAIAWENAPYDPAGAYLRFTFVQGDIAQAELGPNGRNRRTGYAQIDIFQPKGEGIGPALQKAGELEGVFPRGFRGQQYGTSVTITRTDVGGDVQEPDWFHIPVSVFWRSFTDPD